VRATAALVSHMGEGQLGLGGMSGQTKADDRDGDGISLSLAAGCWLAGP
jgi:hypothetical protein